VPTAVASCGTAFGDDHMSVLRRLMLDDDAFRGEVIFTFDGDEAGRKAALKAFEGDQQFAAQTYVAVAPDGMDPCELRQAKGVVAVRDLVARRTPLFEFAIRSLLTEYDLDSVDGQVTALQRTVPLVARIKDRASRDGYATKLAWWVGWADESMVVRRVRESAGEAPAGRRPKRAQPGDPNQNALDVGTDGPARPDPRDQRLQAQRDVLKAALQLPALAGPVYDALPDDAFTHPAYLAVHQAIQAAGGTASGLAGPELAEAVTERCTQSSMRTLVSELSVEVMPTKDENDTRYIDGILAGLQKELVGRQIAVMKSRLQRLNPLTNAEEYRSAFGDLVAFEEYYKALVKRASGVFE
jgi:DNA primase